MACLGYLRLFPHTLHEYGVLCECNSGCVCRISHRSFCWGGERSTGFQIFCLPRPLLVHYAANAILFYQLENSTWCAWCSRLYKVINLGEEDGMLPECGKDQLYTVKNGVLCYTL